MKDPAIHVSECRPSVPAFLRKLLSSTGEQVPRPMTLFLCLLVIPLTMVACHFLTELLAILLLVAGLANLLAKRPMLARQFAVVFIIWSLSLFAPIDLAVKNTNVLVVKLVPVVNLHHGSERIMELESEGKVEGRDYAVYRCSPEFIRARWAILIGLPVSLPLKTPICTAP